MESLVRAAVAGDRRALYATSLFHLTNDAAVTVMAGEITLLQAGLDFRLADTGLLTAVALGTTLVFQILFGRFADVRGPAKLLLLGVGWLGVGSLLIAQANDFGAFLAFVALSRVGAAAYHPVGIPFIGREFSGPDLDRAMGFQSSFGDAGVILGMATSGVLAVALNNWRAAFLLWGAMNLAAVAAGAIILRGRRPAAPARSDRTVDYREVLRDVRVWALPLAIGGASFTIVTTYGTVLLTSARFGLPMRADLAAVLVAVWIAVGSVAAFWFGRISRRFGRYRVLLAAYAGIALTGLVAVIAPGGAGLALTLVCLWTIGALLFVTYPALFSYISERSHARSQGTAFGVIFGFQILGGAGLGWAAGWLAETMGGDAGVPFLVMATAASLGFLYLLAVRARVRRAVPEATA